MSKYAKLHVNVKKMHFLLYCYKVKAILMPLCKLLQVRFLPTLFINGLFTNSSNTVI